MSTNVQKMTDEAERIALILMEKINDELCNELNWTESGLMHEELEKIADQVWVLLARKIDELKT